MPPKQHLLKIWGAGEAMHMQCHVLGLTVKLPREWGRGCSWVWALLAAPHSEVIRGGPGEAAGCMGPLQLQRLGPSKTSRERSQMLERLHPAGTQ